MAHAYCSSEGSKKHETSDLARRTIGMLAALSALLAACGGAPSVQPAAAPKDVVVAVRVADAEEYRMRLTDADDIATARKLLAGEAAPETRGTSVRFRVLIDGQPPEAAHGIDIDEQGNGRLTEQRLYQLIRQPKAISDRQFEIEFLDPGAEAFAFTFG